MRLSQNLPDFTYLAGARNAIIYGIRGDVERCCLFRVCEEMIRKRLFPPSEFGLGLMCGPPGMQDAAMAHLDKWGYHKDKIIIF